MPGVPLVSANIMTINQALAQNFCSVMLGSGTEYNLGAPFQNHVTWMYAGAPGAALLLPTTVPGCDWAMIMVKFNGCMAGQNLQPQGIPRPLWAPPPPTPTGPPPNIHLTSALVVAPLGPNVIFDTSTAVVNIHPIYMAPAGAPNAFDSFAMTGNTYTLDFTVTPFPGFYGLKTWEFRLAPGGERVAVAVNLVDPSHPGST